MTLTLGKAGGRASEIRAAIDTACRDEVAQQLGMRLLWRHCDRHRCPSTAVEGGGLLRVTAVVVARLRPAGEQRRERLLPLRLRRRHLGEEARPPVGSGLSSFAPIKFAKPSALRSSSSTVRPVTNAIASAPSPRPAAISRRSVSSSASGRALTPIPAPAARRCRASAPLDRRANAEHLRRHHGGARTRRRKASPLSSG